MHILEFPFLRIFQTCTPACDLEPCCLLPGNSFPAALSKTATVCSLYNLLRHLAAALLLLTACCFLFPLLFLPAVPSRHLLAPLCLVAAAEGCTLSGLTPCPLRGSGLLAAAPGGTTRSPEPCSGTTGSPQLTTCAPPLFLNCVYLPHSVILSSSEVSRDSQLLVILPVCRSH